MCVNLEFVIYFCKLPLFPVHRILLCAVYLKIPDILKRQEISLSAKPNHSGYYFLLSYLVAKIFDYFN